MKTAKELMEITPSREDLLNDCVEKTVLNFYAQMEKISKDGFTNLTDELLAYFTLNVKREEYEKVLPPIISKFESLGYKVEQPFKHKQKQGSDTVISVSWGE